VRYDAITFISCIDKVLQASVSVYRFKSAWQKFPTCSGTGIIWAFALIGFRVLSLQRHFRVLTKFAYVESRLSGRKGQREAVFYTPINLCDRRPCSTSVAVGLCSRVVREG